MNTAINITIRDRVPYINEGEGVITYNSDYVIEFDFDDEWSENVKTVYFAFEDGTYKAVVIDGTTCAVPTFDNSHKRVFVGVQAGDIRTTRPCCLKILDSIADYVSEAIPDPSEDVYQQIINLINAIPTPSWDTLENKPFTNIGSGLKVEDGTLTATAQGGADITITDTAEVGEVLTVEEVDSEGKPTKWKTEKPTAEQKQADWEQTDTTDASYIKNKPTIPDVSGKVDIAQGTDKSGEYLAVGTDGNVTTVDAPSGGGEQVQSDWNENDETAKSYVKNRPFYISDTTELATLEFTATSSSQLTRTTTAADMALMENFYTKGATFRAVINGRNRDFTTSFDRGYWSGSGQVSFRVNYNPNQTWDITSSSALGLTTGQTYSITFYGLYKGYVKIPTDYLPSSLFTQENAPVKFHEEDGTMLTGVEQGRGTTASGYYSHAEGSGTTASGDYSHAEGCGTTASEYYSHAEGYGTTASGDYSHAEGYNTYASAEITHAEGYGTIADRKWQSVSGKHNLTEGDTKQAEWREAKDLLLLTSNTYKFAKSYTFDEDTGIQTLIDAYSAAPTEDLKNIYVISDGKLHYIKSFNKVYSDTGLEYDAILITANKYHAKYAKIVGNGYGASDGQRSNAYTLDWNGNGWFAGDVYVGSTSGTNKDDGSVKLLKETDVPEWAMADTKPTYTASEVGAVATAQGTANSGKYLAVGTDGNVTATDISKDNVVTALGYTPAKVTEEKWELVKTMTVEESVTSIEITLDEPCSKVIIVGTQPSTETNAVGVTFLIRDSTTNNNISTPYLNAMIASPTYAKSNYTYIWLDGDRMRCEFVALNSSGSSLNTLVAYTCPDISVSCNAITGFNFYRGTGFAAGIVWNIYGVKKEN